MDKAVDVVLGDGLDNALDTVDVHIGVGEVPEFHINMTIPPLDQKLWHTHFVGYWRPTRL